MGKIIYEPKQPHRCAVLEPFSAYARALIGSVYECECGKSWVARQHPARNVLIRHWVRESRFARWIRKRKNEER